jgi:mono/diheme cytochrome c family protein
MKRSEGIPALGLVIVAGAIAMAAAGATVKKDTATTTVISPTPQPVLRGQRVFTQYCAMCHGDAGQGNGDMSSMLMRDAHARPANLSDAARLKRLGRAGVRRVVSQGGAHTGRSNMMPAWAGRLTTRQIDDVTAFVMSLPTSPTLDLANARGEYQTASGGEAKEGATLFQHHCAACHGTQGRGDGTFAPSLMARHKIRPRNLTDSAYMARRTDRDLYATIKLGGGHVGKSPYMPTWGGYLSSGQIKDLVSYLRELSHTPHTP